MPSGPIDPREGPARAGSPLAPPFPDIVIASGRRAVPYLRTLKRASGRQTFTVFLKDPRTGPEAADLVWAPSYDAIRGPNVVTTLTSPHLLSPARLAAARARPDARVARLPRPRVAVLVGGPVGRRPFGRTSFGEDEQARLLLTLGELATADASLLITPSRRTPETLREGLRSLASRHGGFFWDGSGPNPHADILALADAVVVTADSVNMISEAVATGAPVHVFDLAGLGRRHQAFLDGLRDLGALRSFGGRLEGFRYDPLDSTPVIAEAVRSAYLSHRSRIEAA